MQAVTGRAVRHRGWPRCRPEPTQPRPAGLAGAAAPPRRLYSAPPPAPRVCGLADRDRARLRLVGVLAAAGATALEAPAVLIGLWTQDDGGSTLSRMQERSRFPRPA